jgi:hypothetical protein
LARTPVHSLALSGAEARDVGPRLLAHAVHERWPPIKIILASGQLSLSSNDIPQDSRFFGKPLRPDEMIAQMQDMLGPMADPVVRP